MSTSRSRKAKEAFEDGRWHLRSPAERKAVLLNFAKLLERNRHELAVLESLDSGKPVTECQTIDVPDTIHTIRWHAELIDKIYDSTAPVGLERLALVVREPIGVVGCVLPWNFPLLMLAWKIGPALAAGCSVIVKPAEETSLTTLRVAELADEAGVPAGVFNVVTGIGKDGRRADRPPSWTSIWSRFTGSTETGRRFLRYAADSNLKRVVLECGGKNPAVVLDDAEDLDLVAEQVVQRRLLEHGRELLGDLAADRSCVGQGRVAGADRRLHARVDDGRSARSENRVGALVSSDISTKVKSYLDEVKAEKLDARRRRQDRRRHLRRADGRRRRHADSRLFQEEIFGPLLSVTTFSRRVRGHRARQRHGLRPGGIGLHRQPQTGHQGGARDPGGHCDGELLRRGRRHDALRRLQGIRLWRARQVDLRARPVHRAEDDLDRRVRPLGRRDDPVTERVIRRLPVDTGPSGWLALSARQTPSAPSTATGPRTG